MFWSEVDGALLRESAKLAGPVRESIEAQVNIAQIIEQWNLSYPKGSEVTKAEAKAWAKVHIKVDNNELNKGLGILYAIGWIFGRDVATSAYAHARLNKAAPTDEALKNLLNIDWANWTPGNNPGALLASPPGGLKSLLQRRGLDLQGLTNTLLNRIGTHLADALMSGASDTMLGKMLETVVGDPERALTIANTSMASAMSVSTRETYQEFGVAKMRWLALEPCSTCSGNGAMGPVTPGEAVFKNVQGDNITEPPAHPNCRCALAPVIDLDQFKYSETQSRDYRGRWSAGGPAGWDKLEPTAEGRQAAYDKKYQAVMAEAAKNGTPNPTEIATTMAESAAKKYDKYFEEYDMYQKGDIRLDVEKNIPNKAKVAQEYATYVEELSAAYPLGYGTQAQVVVTSQRLLESDYTNGYAYHNPTSGVFIAVNPGAAEANFELAESYERNTRALGVEITGYHMPTATADNIREYTMAHEWGHSYSASRNYAPEERINGTLSARGLKPQLSVYGASNTTEQYAEVFAQSYMESKYPSLPSSPITAIVAGKPLAGDL
jgi:hypothetical protein